MESFFKPRCSTSTSTSTSSTSTTTTTASRSGGVLEALSQISAVLGGEVDGERLLRDASYSSERAMELYFSNQEAYVRASSSSSSSSSAAAAASVSSAPAPTSAPPPPRAVPPPPSGKRSAEPLATGSGTASALDVLTQSARTPRRVEAFCLRLDDAGGLSWTWSLRTPDPSDGAWQRSIRVKEKSVLKDTEVWLCLSCSDADRGVNIDSRVEEMLRGDRPLTGLSVSMLKSILQKNVRRRRAVAAVRVAVELARLDWTQFIRRVAVIMIEDGMLHPAFPLIVYLLIVDSKFHNEFPVPAAIIIALLAIVEEMSTTTLRDDCVYNETQEALAAAESLGRRIADDFGGSSEDGDQQGGGGKKARTCHDESDGPVCATLRSLAVRAQYGGMKGDVAMFLGCASLWARRFAAGGDGDHSLADARRLLGAPPDVPPLPFPAACWYLTPTFLEELRTSKWMEFLVLAHEIPMAPKFVGGGAPGGAKRMEALIATPMKVGDALQAGLDFHVWPEILPAIVAHLAASSEPSDVERAAILKSTDSSEQRNAMWCCMSGLNFRRHLSTGAMDSSLPFQDARLRAIWEAMAGTHRHLAAQRLAAYRLQK